MGLNVNQLATLICVRNGPQSCLNEAVLILTGSCEDGLGRLAHLGVSVHLGDSPPGTSTCLGCSLLVQIMTGLWEETGKL